MIEKKIQKMLLLRKSNAVKCQDQIKEAKTFISHVEAVTETS